MIKERRAVEVLASFLVLVFVLQSCSAEVKNAPVSDAGDSLEGPVVVVSPATAISSSSSSSSSSSLIESSPSTLPSLPEGEEAVDESSPSSPVTRASVTAESGYTPAAMERRPVSYLQEVVSPCLPVDRSGQDPCQGSPVLLTGASSSSSWLLDELPAFDDIMLGNLVGRYVPAVVPHIVIRGLVQPDTTRCELYWVEAFAYRNLPPAGYAYFCFAEVSVHEYIIGEGPAQITVAMHREPIFLTPQQAADWSNIREWMVPGVLGDPGLRTAAAYEGKEMVLFLRIPIAAGLESWALSGWWGNTWFLQRNEEGEIRALEQDYNVARTDKLRSQLDLPLSELVERIKKAAENRAVVTEGRIGLDSALPMLVTDANRLQNFYVSAGAVYEGDDAPVLPPPVPGGDEPEQDPTQTDVEEPVPVPPVPGEEETSPPPVDDVVTTSTSTTTEPQAGDAATSSTAVTTTTMQPQAEEAAPPTTGTTLPEAGSDTTVPAVDTGTTQPQAEGAASSTASTTQPPDDEDAALPEEGDELPTPTGTTRPSDDGGGAGPAVGDDAGVGTGQ